MIKIYAAIVVVALAFYSGWAVNGWRHNAMKAKALEVAIKKADVQTKTDEKVVGEAEAKKQETRIVYKTIYKEIDRVKDSDCSVHPDLVRVWNNANQQAGSSTPR